MTSLLVTNDFPPKVGGIQSYLFELWRRLPPDETTVLTTRYAGDREWDSNLAFRVVRTPESQLWPTRSLARRIDALARDVGADVIFLDPWFPLGVLGPRLGAAPYVVVVHGAEVSVPRRVPGARAAGVRSLRAAAGVLAAGRYPAREAVAAAGPLRGLVIPPGVDVARFRPLDAAGRVAAVRELGLNPDGPLVLGMSRLVPRKGFDVLLDAVAALDHNPREAVAPAPQVVIAGDGRDRRRLERRAARLGLASRTRFLGRVADDVLPRLLACADVFAMPCRDRWGGLEAEGFGIVFLEAAAAGVPAVAGRSGGSDEAVVDGRTGRVVPGSVDAVRHALASLLADPALRETLGASARARVETEFDYDALAARLAPLAAGDLSRLDPL